MKAAWPGLAAWPGALQPSALILPVAVLLIYVGLEWVSFLHEYKGMPVTPWNPGLGVAFAFLVLSTGGYWFVLFAGVVIAEILVLRTELAWPVIVAMAGIIAASFAMGGVAARRQLRLDPGVAHVRDVLGLLAVGALAATVSAWLLTLLLLAADELRLSDLAQASLPLLVGDVIGIAVMTPLVLRLRVRWPDMRLERLGTLAPELALHLVVIGVTLWAIVHAGVPGDTRFFALLFLPVVAAALRHGIDGSCVSLAAIQLGLVALLRLNGVDAAAFTDFQLLMLVLTTSGLLVGVVVSERQRADAAAREAAARLEEMQGEATRALRLNMVSGMASALAHEINQPMTAARALARSVQQIVRAPEVDLPRADANLATLVAQIDHAGGVVQRMREFLRRGQPHFSTLDMHTLLQEALVLAPPDAAARRIAIELEVADALPAVFGDRVQLQQVVLSLVHNALDAITEAGSAGGRIRIGVRRGEEGAVEVSVTDNGAGVAPGRQLFEPLSSSKKDGLGLGLSICASIVQAHGGRIWLQASAPGATEFRFSLPVQRGA